MPIPRTNLRHGLRLLQRGGLVDLGLQAREIRRKLHPGGRVTFVIDTNPNYSNICETGCSFCAFSRKKGGSGAYTLSVPDILKRVALDAKSGATTMLLQGGCNAELPLDYHLEIVREIRRKFPDVTPHCFSAPEILSMAKTSGLAIGDVLKKLHAAGQRTLPGGGAEILSDRVRRKISPRKCSSAEWLAVHRAAHRLGFKSTATMMFGHVETDPDIMTHLDAVRRLQDETGGFTAFVPWSFKPGGSPLGRKIARTAGAARYLRIIAVARIFLDNFPHIQASWFSEGKRAGQIALHFGADDFGGTLLEENVHREAGFAVRAGPREVAALIRGAGFSPVQRTTLYDIVKAW